MKSDDCMPTQHGQPSSLGLWVAPTHYQHREVSHRICVLKYSKTCMLLLIAERNYRHAQEWVSTQHKPLHATNFCVWGTSRTRTWLLGGWTHHQDPLELGNPQAKLTACMSCCRLMVGVRVTTATPLLIWWRMHDSDTWNGCTYQSTTLSISKFLFALFQYERLHAVVVQDEFSSCSMWWLQDQLAVQHEFVSTWPCIHSSIGSWQHTTISSWMPHKQHCIAVRLLFEASSPLGWYANVIVSYATACTSVSVNEMNLKASKQVPGHSVHVRMRLDGGSKYTDNGTHLSPSYQL